MTARRVFVALLVAATAVAAAAAGGRAGAQGAAPQQDRRAPAAPAPAWPEAPAPPRVVFAGSLIPGTSQAQPSMLGRLWRALVGQSERPVMRQPHGLTVAPDGKLYVADTADGVIHVFDLLKRGYSRIETGGESLVGIASRAGELFVTDSARARVFSLTTSGRKRWSIGPEQGLQRPTGIVATEDRLFVVDTLAAQVLGIEYRGVITSRFGSRGNGVGQFNFPTSIAVDRENRLYVTDTLNFRVQVLDRAGTHLLTIGRLGDGSGDFSRPKGLGLDSDGNIHVVEGLYDVVQIFRQDGRFLLAYGEPGSGAGQLWLASGLAVAGDAIYVSDTANRRVQVYKYLRDQR